MTREQAILDFIEELSPFQMHGFILTLKGETLAQASYAPFRTDEPHRVFSVSKSVVSLAIGMLADAGTIALDDPICAHFPEWVGEETPALLMDVTIRDMLRMATCYDRSMYSALGDKDWTRPFFQGQPNHVPGTVFSYDTSASQVMCALVERKTGRDILSFMQEKLFDPLGMNGPKRWLKDGRGVSQGGTGLIMTLKDMSLLAQFLMSDGKGLVSAAYLRAATSRQIATDERPCREERYGYGYQFWMMREGFSMYGLGGQMAMCLKDKQLTLVTNADLIGDATGVQPIYDAFFRHLSRIDTLQSDPGDAARLQARLQTLRVEPLRGTTQPPVGIALARGTLPFRELAIAADHVEFTINGQKWRLPYENGAWATATFPDSAEKCLVSGGWEGQRFTLRAELCGDFSAGMTLFVVCRERFATVRVVSSLWEFQAGWSGEDWGTIQA